MLDVVVASGALLLVVVVAFLVVRRQGVKRPAREPSPVAPLSGAGPSDATDPSALLEQAVQAHLKAGDTDRAAALYAKSGDFARAAEVLRRAGRWEQAAQTLAGAGLVREAARVLEEVGQVIRAAVLWQQAGEIERAAALYERGGNAARASQLRAGGAAASRGQWTTTATLRSSTSQMPRAPSTTPATPTPAATPRGRSIEEPDWGAADPSDAQRAAQEQHPKRLATAAALAKAGKYLDAANLYQQESEFREAAHCYFRAGDHRQAIHYLEVVEDWLTLGRIYLQAGETDKARDTLARVDDSDPKAWRSAHLKLADLERAAGRVAEAAEQYDALVMHCLARKEELTEAQRWTRSVAELRMELGDPDAAIEAIERLAEHRLLTDDLKQHLVRIDAQTRGFEAEKTILDRAIGNTMLLVRHPRYEFQEKLGQGGNGVVYRARDRTLGRQLVIKMIVESAIPSELARQWFMREAKMAAMLSHENIVTIYDLGEVEGQLFIAMEYVQGRDLESILSEQGAEPLDPRFIVKVYRQLTSALQYAHNEGTMHRDIKLENVMVVGESKVKLMDFGLANAIGGSEDSMMTVGTPMYMAPEVITGQLVDHRADIYAMGVMLYVLCTGDWPFEPENVFEHHISSPVPDPREVEPQTPAGFVPIIRRAMAKRLEDRYPSIEAMWGAMAAVDLGGRRASR
jgi:tRNA A-37 threonylcarbamoyl transferase component Bud32